MATKCEKLGCTPRINNLGVSWCTDCGKLFTFNPNHKPINKNFLTMQKVKGEFTVIPDLKIEEKYLKDKEICIKDKTDNKLYARSYIYKPGICNIVDRPLSVNYHEEIIDGKKKVTFEYL